MDVTVQDLIDWLRNVHQEIERAAEEAVLFLKESGFGRSGPLDRWDATACSVRTSAQAGRWLIAHPEACPGPDVVSPIARHMALHDPAAALARVTAERRLIDRHYCEDSRDCSTCGDAGIVGQPCPTLELLASGWRHMPGWMPEWDL